MTSSPSENLNEDDVIEDERSTVERQRSELRDFVSSLSPDDIKSGGWFTKLCAQSLKAYTTKVDAKYFQEKYQGVPAIAVVDQRIKMASRYAAIEGGLSAGAYTTTIAATIGTLGGASPATVPAAIATVMVDVAFITQLQLRLAYDISVLYRVPLDIADPEDMWKLIRVAFTIKGGEIAREGVVKIVPAMIRPLVKRFYSKSVLTAAKSLPIVGKFLLKRNVIKIGLPLVGVPLAVIINRYTTLVAGRHAESVFRNEARIIEIARRLSERTTHPRLLLWVAWLVIMADNTVSDDEAMLIRHLVVSIRKHHDVIDEGFANIVDIDPDDVWQLIDIETGDFSDVVDAATKVANVDSSMNREESAVIAKLLDRIRHTQISD
ncbi:hypothetical protein [Glutamicibacter halophytocola]|uniref:Co-chaperone DjlA N-terminal domain-containing protein n=1 Tax=Glutamicibacter halophytocola TaxID=1933880 RepID=A0AA95BVF5_9MICC|nr:hypothetical protein [Glutamicibacter halophytocola]ALG28765.1 hypothetical protein AOZ07_07030 [Glutamicibacter halophytocola]UUX60328.1 hypothetical protein NUH22_06870 [Glutamicibacter halophytocola]